ncbi:MAG TPA: hypothetical protein GX697_04885 [Firmicutes bacterium]|nr:hypothetical protein [Bacillota bacterium]
MGIINLRGKKIGFALPESHATLDQIFLEMQKLRQEGAEIFPLLLTDEEPGPERREIIDKLEQLTGRDLDSLDEEEEGFDLLVVAPCPGNILGKILNAAATPATMVKVLTHLQTARPIVLALVANGDSGDLVAHIEHLLALKTIYLVPFAATVPRGKQVILTRMDLIKETVVHAFLHKQIQPVIFEEHWFPS